MKLILTILQGFSQWDRGPNCLGVYYSRALPAWKIAECEAACYAPINMAARMIVRILA